MTDTRDRCPEGIEEAARWRSRRGIPQPLAGVLCEPESCAVPDLEECPWPFMVVWAGGGWDHYVKPGYVYRAPLYGLLMGSGHRPYWRGERFTCLATPHKYSIEETLRYRYSQRLLKDLKAKNDNTRAGR